MATPLPYTAPDEPSQIDALIADRSIRNFAMPHDPRFPAYGIIQSYMDGTTTLSANVSSLASPVDHAYRHPLPPAQRAAGTSLSLFDPCAPRPPTPPRRPRRPRRRPESPPGPRARLHAIGAAPRAVLGLGAWRRVERAAPAGRGVRRVVQRAGHLRAGGRGEAQRAADARVDERVRMILAGGVFSQRRVGGWRDVGQVEGGGVFGQVGERGDVAAETREMAREASERMKELDKGRG
ncbi:uncharacterized protein BDZ99DRAFT_474213 [Mytilinidion resinicola]|uniref:Uncharacterized protein n=1 Tax=Mytilinidion resinicola TaxID=574789 RepID=A0A6A6YXA7_9PEZI|nr:uncharacterized protein BDZ99DRAFT_474213 [Mytilinidion resinicola]KAF2813582.1 hypothetical protein BDZ99DRAFT_474213 [Mytilinidion resinicola]